MPSPRTIVRIWIFALGDRLTIFSFWCSRKLMMPFISLSPTIMGSSLSVLQYTVRTLRFNFTKWFITVANSMFYFRPTYLYSLQIHRYLCFSNILSFLLSILLQVMLTWRQMLIISVSATIRIFTFTMLLISPKFGIQPWYMMLLALPLLIVTSSLLLLLEYCKLISKLTPLFINIITA